MLCVSRKKFICNNRYLLCLGMLALAVGLWGCGGDKTDPQQNVEALQQESMSWQDAEALQQENESQQDSEISQQESEAWQSVEMEQETSWRQNIVQEEILIEGLEGEYDLLFLTDTHAVLMGDTDSQQVAENAAARYPAFVNGEGISSENQLADWVDTVNMIAPDAVLLGGDIIDFPSEASMAFLEEQLARLQSPYLYTLGNHDWTFPWEYMTEVGKEMYLPLFEPYMSDNTAFHTMDFGEFVVAAVDDSSGQVNPEALEAYRVLLAEGRPVILMLHVPFSTSTLLEQAGEIWSGDVSIDVGDGGIEPNGSTTAFYEMTVAADSPVELILAGHVHFYDSGVISGEKDVLQIVGDAGFHDSAVRLHITGK